MLEDIFALGAANGKSILFKRLLMTGCFGNLTAKLFFLFVTLLSIILLLFNLRIKVNGPGQNFL